MLRPTSEQGIPKTIVPSLPAASFDDLKKLAEALDGVSYGFQIDIVDGQFVPHTSWPFTERDPVKEIERIHELPQSYQYELDCMVKEPEQYLALFASLPLERVIIHVGSTNCYGPIIRHAREHGYKIGLAFTNDVPLSFIYPYIDKIDFVQIMGIAKVGQQGQPFDERTLESARTLREQYSNLSIAVDGSVNAETIPRLLEAGVNHFAPGSAISKANSPAIAYKQLATLLE
jgi:ribulose-phosphate 3-epimerase